MKQIETIKDGLLKLFTISFIIVFLYVLYTGIWQSATYFHDMNWPIIIVGLLFFVLFLYMVDCFFSRLTNKKLIYTSIGLFAAMFLVQVLFAKEFLVNPSWDFWYILNEGKQLAKGSTQLNTYFYERYPNNIGVALLLSFIYKIADFFSVAYLKVGILFNITMINVAIGCMYFLVYKLVGLSKATLMMLFILFITPFYSYTSIVYTDTITMVFPVVLFVLLYLHVHARENENNRFSSCFYLLGIGIIASIGTILKTNIILTVIAIVIYLLFTNKFLTSMKKIALILIPFFIMNSMYQLYATKLIPIPYKEAGFPSAHWLMMGLKGPYGGFSDDDYQFTKKIREEHGKEAAQEANIDMIKERLSDYGFTGYLKFANQKVEATWGDGTYFAPEILRRKPMNESSFYPYVVGEEGTPQKDTFFVYMSQFSHVALLLGIVLSGFSYYKQPRHFIKGLQITLIGVFLFLILWETKSRYLVCYLPILVITAVCGFDYLFKWQIGRKK